MEVVDEGQVEVTATEVAVVGGRLDGELALLELDNGAGVVAVANVDKEDALGLLFRPRQVELGDAPPAGSVSVLLYTRDQRTHSLHRTGHDPRCQLWRNWLPTRNHELPDQQ